MTKSTITRERIQRIIRAIDSESYDEEEIREWLTSDEIMELARMALAAMGSEPHTDDELSNLLWYSQEATCHSDPNYYCEFQRLATPGLIAGIIRELQERRKADSEPVENHIGSKNSLDAIVSFIKSKSNPTVKCYEEVSEQLFKDNCHGIHSHVIEYILKLGEELEDFRAEQAEMPPAQPVADSEPDRNPVLAYADSYRDMAKQGVESVPIWSVITDLERNIAPLYRHAQPAPVEVKGSDDLYDVIDDDGNVVLSAISYNEAQTESDGYNGENLYIVRHEAQPAPVVPDDVLNRLEHEANHITAWHHMDEHSCKVNRRDLLTLVNSCRSTMLPLTNEGDIHGGNSPVIGIDLASGPDRTVEVRYVAPPGYVMVPKEMTDEIGDAIAMQANCCGGIALDIYDAMLAAAPQSPGSEPATVPGKWIPVSEQMPDREVDVQVYCPDKKEQMVAYLERNELDGYFRFATWRTGDGIYCQPTHWMPLPAAPQEGK